MISPLSIVREKVPLPDGVYLLHVGQVEHDWGFQLVVQHFVTIPQFAILLHQLVEFVMHGKEGDFVMSLATLTEFQQGLDPVRSNHRLPLEAAGILEAISRFFYSDLMYPQVVVTIYRKD
jgi:hypothetical protein